MVGEIDRSDFIPVKRCSTKRGFTNILLPLERFEDSWMALVFCQLRDHYRHAISQTAQLLRGEKVLN